MYVSYHFRFLHLLFFSPSLPPLLPKQPPRESWNYRHFINKGTRAKSEQIESSITILSHLCTNADIFFPLIFTQNIKIHWYTSWDSFFSLFLSSWLGIWCLTPANQCVVLHSNLSDCMMMDNWSQYIASFQSKLGPVWGRVSIYCDVFTVHIAHVDMKRYQELHLYIWL